MKRSLLVALGCAIRCFIRGQHVPKRHPLGGFTCLECLAPGRDLDEMGFLGNGYVLPMRKVFSRERHEVTQTQEWEAGKRGW
jgi:hypothetical protein